MTNFLFPRLKSMEFAKYYGSYDYIPGSRKPDLWVTGYEQNIYSVFIECSIQFFSSFFLKVFYQAPCPLEFTCFLTPY